MDTKEIYYGALVDYRKRTRNQTECSRQRKQIARADANSDLIEVVKTECEIDDDWMDAIEVGLEFIDKAIKEERQFILSNGEVIPIEKVKNVSKESVEHLAKHSNLLTRLPKEGSDMIPDKLYTVERLTDYAVYENRFLYMLLCYLRDFISLRYDALVELTTTYSGTLKLHKTIHSGNRNTVVEISLDEQLKNDEYLRKHNSAREKIHRIDGLLKGVISFLSHPLMEAVSSAPMLKPPITETNVLKMNKNFKGAMQLYYFVTAYDKKGYEVHQTTHKLTPFKELVADELAEVVELCSFLTYEHGMGVSETFKEAYEAQLQREKEEEQKKKLEQLKALRRRIKEQGGNPEEYMLLLEQRNRVLEADSVQLIRARAELKAYAEQVESLQGEIASLNAQIEAERRTHEEEVATLNGEIASLHTQMEEMQRAHEEAVAALHAEYAEKLRLQAEEYEGKLSALLAEWQEKLRAQAEEYEQKLAALAAEHEAELHALLGEWSLRLELIAVEYEEKRYARELAHTQALDFLKSTHAGEVARIRGELNKSREESELANSQLAQTTEAKYLAEARLNALKKQSGLYSGNEDYNSEMGFDELEKQYRYFKALFQEQWKLTKKKIRKQYLKGESSQAEDKDHAEQ